MPVVCFGCGIYSHTQELCPKADPPNTPERVPDPPAEISDNSHSIRLDNSRFNPIFINDVDSTEVPVQADSMPGGNSSIPSTSLDKENDVPAVNPSKAKNKSVVSLRKPHAVILGLKNMNTKMSHLPGSSLVSSVRHSKGRIPSGVQNSTKHLALNLPPNDNPALPRTTLVRASSLPNPKAKMSQVSGKISADDSSISAPQNLTHSLDARVDMVE
ncbi:hypothetical protein V6N13_047933 [Hibiscus sabdariffa]